MCSAEEASRQTDKQIVEIQGRNWLVTELYRSGLEVARPERDHGIDLIAFLDLDKSKKFVAKPIQMKARSKESFVVRREFKRINDLLIVYVWNVADPQKTQCYCLTVHEVMSVARRMGYTKTLTWREKGRYVTTRSSKKLRALLEDFKMTPDKWRPKLGI